ncbi:hypothetical protein N7457_005945 [Penicillium paradoxum]|uniref:uncharacterized protein n=1 Tax=Penicillium paradoxum TaxID=176176 RepID=UPI002546C46D|nr:uncharacterized protein N7457_005945 [Penicillium paradoxum]KAJ5780785.1 hypothetical protein N7457_005945 [Penicillium paradoxum]
MRFFNLVGLLLAGATATSAANSTCAPTSSDAKVLQFAWGLSDFIGGYYNSTVNSTFSSSSNATILAYKKILYGVEKENTLGSKAIEKVGAKADGFSQPECEFKYPKATTPQAWAQWAYHLESTVTGAFIGLAGYTQSPEVSFLLARLAASHSAHAALIGSRVNSTLFAQNATSLVSAYGPAQVLSTRNQTGSLGQYLGDCLSVPSSPCGSLNIGPLAATPSSSGVAHSTSATVSSTTSSQTQ